MNNNKLFADGKEETSKAYAIIENIIILAGIALGYMIMAPITTANGIPALSILYTVFVLSMLGIVLRKHVCTHCYYYGKWCHCGWGKIASMFQKESGNYTLGIKLAMISWLFFFFAPIASFILILIMGWAPAAYELTCFIPFAILMGANLVMHKKDCSECKMRFICPASVSKK
ncbi:MAG: hypothetical protein ABIJ26_04520 [Candidatus Margulisiibacteriota bacterium]|nr:hypothetical protein [Candidatus Margulisiibacteriota bacterium]